MEAKKFENQAPQGDLFLFRMGKGDEIPARAKRVLPKEGRVIVAHSETGHDHYFDAATGVEFYTDPEDPLICYLRVSSGGATLLHDRSFDTHKPISVKPGNYWVHRQREYTPEGWRRVED